MQEDLCFWFACLVPVPAFSERIFTFSEFLAGLALMVLAWMTADSRYRFRIATAPIPLRHLTFGIVGSVGFLVLLTDLWQAQHWLVPRGNFLSPATWEALLAGLFLVTFLVWALFSFISPPEFGRANATRFHGELYRAIVRGSPGELAEIADEFARSVRTIVAFAPGRRARKGDKSAESEKISTVSGQAHDVLLLIGDRRFCRAVAQSAPITALRLFREMTSAEKLSLPVAAFARNLLHEAIGDSNSFLFHETEAYSSGLVGHDKPVSQAMFGNYRLVEATRALDADYRECQRWTPDQWDAYCRAVLVTFEDFAKSASPWQHSFAMHNAIDRIARSTNDLFRLNGVASSSRDDEIERRLGVVVDFLRSAVEILNRNEPPERYRRGLLRSGHEHGSPTIYDTLARAVFEVVHNACSVRAPVNLCWSIQYVSVRSQLYSFGALEGPGAKIVKLKLRRLIYDSIADMKKKDFPNFEGARVLSFCLNVLGFEFNRASYDPDSRALQAAVLTWVRAHYSWLRTANPLVAQESLPEGVVFDPKQTRLVKTYPVRGLRKKAVRHYFPVNP